ADRPIKDQGITKSPIRIGADVWLANKVTVVRGVHIGDGSVVGANAVVTSDLPPYSIAAGVPARVIRSRLDDHEANSATRAALSDMASKHDRARPADRPARDENARQTTESE
ncbi:MAG: acetyltransferase, partial [Frankiales bacterium]|nr:acetyltransferase [Frankiales bacterium]